MAYTKPQNPALMEVLKDELTEASKFLPGSLVDVRLLKKTAQAAYFEVGRFGTGMVFGAELQRASDILKDMDVGDTVAAKVEDLDGYQGYIELSLSKAGRQRAWQRVQELGETGEIIEVKITGANRGGLLVNIDGLRGFLPLSQLSQKKVPESVEGNDDDQLVEDLEEHVGDKVSVKVIDVRPDDRKLIVSERETLEPTADMEELLDEYEVGQVVEGVVSGIADFGVFVKFADNPDVEGLVHISEIDHRIIDSPKEVVEPDEEVKVKIIDIRDGRVFLSMKALREDPWEEVAGEFNVGDEVKGEVYTFNPFGAVISLNNGLQGLIHVSEYGGTDQMKVTLKEGKTYSFTVAAIKPEEKRITLKPGPDQLAAMEGGASTMPADEQGEELDVDAGGEED